MILALFFLTTFGIFGVFFSPKSKYPKKTILKKWKFEDFFSKIQQLISHFIYIIVIVWFFLLFVCFSDFHVFQYCEKCVAVTPSRFQYFNISTKQNFLSNKKSRSMSLRYGLGAKNPILPTFGTKTQRLGTKLCWYELIIHAYKEENCIDTLSFIEK